MKKKLLVSRARERLRGSLWVIPAIVAFVAFCAAELLVRLDRYLDRAHEGWFLFDSQPESARQLLSTIASSMMTMMGLVFSITILVLQLASSQFSPRVLRSFLEDRITHVAMGAFVSTFVFALALLPHVSDEDASGTASFVPALSVFLAFALALVTVGIFVFYIDHMAHSVRVTAIIKKIGAETRRSIVRMHPHQTSAAAAGADLQPSGPPDRVVCHEAEAGVLAGWDEEELVQLATAADAVIALVPMPGDFVPRGAPLFKVWGSSGPDCAALHAAVAIEEERTAHQDPAFGFRQLVDIAERALSPGINDPTTAVQALDEIHDLLRSLGQKGTPSPWCLDAGGSLRLVVPRPSWEAYVHLALDEIRNYGGRSLQVLRRVRALLDDCLLAVPVARRGPLLEQLQLLNECVAREIDSPAERALARSPNPQGQGGAA